MIIFSSESKLEVIMGVLGNERTEKLSFFQLYLLPPDFFLLPEVLIVTHLFVEHLVLQKGII